MKRTLVFALLLFGGGLALVSSIPSYMEKPLRGLNKFLLSFGIPGLICVGQSRIKNVRPLRSLGKLRNLLKKKKATQEEWAEESNMNPCLVSTEYAVRGPILDRAMELGEQLENGVVLPFEEIISCNIGNPQALNQKPLSFVRDVLSLIINPRLINDCRWKYDKDVLAWATDFLGSTPSGAGAYSNSQGLPFVRDKVAAFISARDGHPADPSKIFLTNGASEGVRYIMQGLLRPPSSGFKDGILVPIPQYPLYSAMSTLLEGNLVPYYLDESKDWGLSADSLRQAVDNARARGISVRALVVINPGNPTGQCLSEENMREVAAFCAERRLVLCADEVYQENVWTEGNPFTSFKRVVRDMGFEEEEGERRFQLISFHSTSKGFIGECGLRGGYFEMFGFAPEVRAQLYKLASVSLCSNTLGQVAVGLMVDPPTLKGRTRDRYEAEKAAILQSMKKRSVKLVEALNRLEGVTCNLSQGAMYAFPQITVPAKAAKAAEAKGVKPDAMYCMDCLEATGIVMVPGSGFGQVEGTWHFRTTFLPSDDQIDSVIGKISKFHEHFMEKYS